MTDHEWKNVRNDVWSCGRCRCAVMSDVMPLEHEGLVAVFKNHGEWHRIELSADCDYELVSTTMQE